MTTEKQQPEESKNRSQTRIVDDPYGGAGSHRSINSSIKRCLMCSKDIEVVSAKPYQSEQISPITKRQVMMNTK